MKEIQQQIDLEIDLGVLRDLLVTDPQFLDLLTLALANRERTKQLLTTATTPNPRSKIQQPIVQQSQTSQTPLAQ